MGGFMTGLIGGLGEQVKQRNERDINARHQASQMQAQQYYKMGDEAAKNGDHDLAAEYYKAGFGLHTLSPEKKASSDQMNAGLILQNFLKNGGQMNKGQQPSPGVLSPNGMTPAMSPNGSMQPASNDRVLAQPPAPLSGLMPAGGGGTGGASGGMRPLSAFDATQ